MGQSLSFHPPDGTLNIANMMAGCTTLGPGTRAVIWVQGCPFGCLGCIAKTYTEDRVSHLVKVETLVDWIDSIPDIIGLTISGGEPFFQTENITTLVNLIRSRRDLDIIVYTGFRLYDLLLKPEAHELLKRIDTLIDGRYVDRLNDNRGLRGSSNQRIIHLTDRNKDFDFKTEPRKQELIISDGELVLAGVPDQQFASIMNLQFEPIEPLRGRHVGSQEDYRHIEPGRIPASV